MESWKEHCSQSNNEIKSNKLQNHSFSWVHQKAEVAIRQKYLNSKEKHAPKTGEGSQKIAHLGQSTKGRRGHLAAAVKVNNNNSGENPEAELETRKNSSHWCKHKEKDL